MRRVPTPRFPAKRLRIVFSRKGYVIVTEKGVEFVRERYSCSVPLAHEDIRLYGFLMRLISFGGIVPLSSIKRWGLWESLSSAKKEQCVNVTSSTEELPRREIQEVIEEIWGEIPRGFCI